MLAITTPSHPLYRSPMIASPVDASPPWPRAEWGDDAFVACRERDERGERDNEPDLSLREWRRRQVWYVGGS